MKTAVIYCRVSSQEQVTNFSLTNQKKACLEYCQREGYSVAEIFIEEGESAKTYQRTQFQRMISYCQKNKGKIDTVVVNHLDRFARNTKDHMTVRAILHTVGVNLRSVSQNIDETSNGRFMETIFAGVAQWDNDVRAEKTVTGMKAALQA